MARDGERFLTLSHHHSSRNFAARFRGAARSARHVSPPKPPSTQANFMSVHNIFFTFSFPLLSNTHTISGDSEHSPSVFAGGLRNSGVCGKQILLQLAESMTLQIN